MRHATIINLLKHAATSEQRTAANPAEPPDATNEPSYIAHFRESTSPHPLRPVVLETEANAKQAKHPVYDLDEISSIEQTHHAVGGLRDRLALAAIKTVRTGFDILSGYRGPGGGMTEKDWVHRCLFLETVAGVPGMVAGMLRHLRSLRLLKRDHGWIHTLLEEAENERMHLLIFMNLKHPGWVFRALVVGAQGVFFNGFFLAYLASPQTCHRFVGYLEEEAVKTYTGLLKDIEDGHLGQWKTKQAPLLAQTYYRLPEDASVYDVIKCVRADEGM
ncbi:unnamed protein product [Phytophthora lilii]|uniref:Unnamed protein product n=1 Tax=Phytophthora lilii TaxID=2077276 RepID=A0A9W6TDD0_9STRA|nr:unnamed protein product [Phytophthora lilii]